MKRSSSKQAKLKECILYLYSEKENLLKSDLETKRYDFINQNFGCDLKVLKNNDDIIFVFNGSFEPDLINSISDLRDDIIVYQRKSCKHNCDDDFSDLILVLTKKQNGSQKEPRYSKEQIIRLKSNPNVSFLKKDSVVFTKEFKRKAVMEYYMKKEPNKIFEDAGFILSDLSDKKYYARNAIIKWRSEFDSKNELSCYKYNPQKIKSNRNIKGQNEFLNTIKELIRKMNEINEKF